MKRGILSILACITILLVGCNEDQIRKAEEAVAAAQAATVKVDSGLATATQALITAQGIAKTSQEALAQAMVLAEQLKSREAQEVVAKAQEGLAKAQAVVTVLQDAVPAAQAVSKQAHAALEQASVSVQAAKAAQEAGGSSFDVIVAGLLAFFTGAGGGLIARAGRTAKALVAARLAAKHGDRMEEASDDAAVAAAKQISVLEQSAAGVKDLLDKIRNKA